MLKPTALALALALTALAAPAMASDLREKEIVSSDAFLGHHPDLRFRLAGVREYERGDYARAMTLFKRAARFGDKPSQAMIGEMYWRGEGVQADPVEAYIWMDLAAERQYRLLAIQREKYWAGMDAAQRAAALERGPGYYDEYGDAVAKPRLERKLRQGKRNVTGSRTGFVGNLRIVLPTPTGEIEVSGNDFYQDEYWDVDQYWSWQEKSWNTLPTGRVDIGPLQTEPVTPESAPGK